MKGYNLLIFLISFTVAFLGQQDTVHVHLIPHSHDDYGWIFSIQELYNNPSPFKGQGAVKNILNSVFTEVQKSPFRKFNQVEIGYLDIWWDSLTEEQRDTYKSLVQSGQIEILNGGWVMHDEATAYFEDIIENMTVGHLWVQDKLNITPTVGWQIDPFGHQNSNAALYSQMGLNAQWFARIDYQDYAQRSQNKEFEMIWSPEQNSGEQNYIFSAVNYKHYSPPQNFSFETDQPVTKQNIAQKAQEFVQYFQTMNQYYRGKHLLHTMGDDFAYSKANIYYENMDLLMEYINSHNDQYNMKILYSTPSNYLKELQKQNESYPVNKYDFLPYADKASAYWTGYFTSRPSIKGFTKDSGRYLQAIRNIFSVESILKISNQFKNNYQDIFKALQNFEQQVAMMMHHDAITGTERQKVAYDYIQRLNNGYSLIRDQLHPLLQEYTEKQINEKDIDYVQCNWNATITQCDITQQQLSQGLPVLLMIYNPSTTRQQLTRIKVPPISLLVLNVENSQIAADVICSNPQDDNDCDLYFVDKFEGYSFQYYKIKINVEKNSIVKPLKKEQSSDQINIDLSQSQSLSIDTMTLNFTLSTREKKQIKNDHIKSNKFFSQKHHSSKTKKSFQSSFQIQYNFYMSSTEVHQPSGAYVFRPAQTPNMPYSEIKSATVYQGEVVTVVLLDGTKTTTQLRFSSIYPQKQVCEVETFIHSIDVDDGIGKEVVMLINTNYKNDRKFFTDSNGLELQQRQINYRNTWVLNQTDPVSGNYYPIGAIIGLEDTQTKQRVLVVNDRSQGGTSLNEGEIEIMIHRRTLKDDDKGVSESLNEFDDIKPKQGLQQKVRHYIIFEKEKESTGRLIQNHLDSANQIFISKTSKKKFQLSQDFNNLFENSPLVSNKNPYLRVYLKQFEDYYTLRLYNIHDFENAEFKLDSKFQILDELTLTANQSKQAMLQNKYKWKADDGQIFQPSIQSNLDQEKQTNSMTIKPLQLRVFKISFVD
ncbi:glycoside hydrolase family 38 amine-terminal domain protein (macronuclear) [Tetrahymena thermophila SB210]|uniref:Glycoside hydrolase family 38 amine-terminal domain protein n=1 Tax=Tetrahymena thermophila (strain SB210) TaxID=312017 RepID=Q241S9_TETTS|nr:glycoside hydrolase family 38 amine-terminal domain protein [Tetrahymena thermophila SB210]EAS02491.2 glycoside hydrolase family 38 amine-terminal domain protein [Tetrahymena thermophila SB210]|eukprot:XP_001022736.2 glycoside hydrolase family 38 amine-terminal domain protein [Tetrahymena thermophila SB210]